MARIWVREARVRVISTVSAEANSDGNCRRAPYEYAKVEDIERIPKQVHIRHR